MNVLSQIQSKLKASKSNYNSFGNYKYRSCEDILESVKPLLKEHNAYITITDDVLLIGERIYVKSTAKIKSKDFEECVSAFAREPEVQKGMNDSQITGSSSSYARKYALNGLLAIDDTKDSDATNTHDVGSLNNIVNKSETPIKETNNICECGKIINGNYKKCWICNKKG